MQNLIIQKRPEIRYKKEDKGENAAKQYVDVLAKVSSQKKKQKATATLENVVDVFYLEHVIKMKLSISLTLLKHFVSQKSPYYLHRERGFSWRKGSSFSEMERYHIMTVSV